MSAPGPTASPATGRYRWWVLGAVGASVALRLRFLATPLSVDEAGALVVARSWGRGARLYTDVFVDRPQGVVALFQRWDAIAGGHTSAVRVLAVVAGAAVVVGAAATARAVSGSWRAGAAAAWLVAVLSSSAAIEGYAANGELLAGACTVPAMAVGAAAAVRRIPPPWMALAGVLAGAGLSVKQSGFDVLVALGAWIVVAGIAGWRTRREAAVLAGWLVLGCGSVLAVAAVHGASLGWDAYAYAMWGFRARARSAIAGAQIGRMGLTLLLAVPLFAPAAALALVRIRRSAVPLRARVRPAHVLVLLWAAAAAGAFFVGGNYHRHYWIQLTFPFAVLVGIVLSADPRPDADRRLVRSIAGAVALPLAVSLVLIAKPGLERDDRVDADRALAEWVRSHRDAPGDELLPLCASVTYYAEAGTDPPYPYLWVDHVRDGRDGPERLADLLTGPARPAFVALHQPVSRCDPSGQVAAALEQHYERVATVDGVPVLRATG